MKPCSSALTTLATWLAGEFDNQAQAREEPAWYVPVRLWHRPLDIWHDRGFAFYAEQSNALKLDQPYRPRVFLLSETGGHMQVDYFQIREDSPVRGGGRSPEKLQGLTPEKLISLPGCTLMVSHTPPDSFTAQPQSDCDCCFTVAGVMRQVELGFDSRSDQLLTYDKGIDPKTRQPIWGALMGPYHFHKIGSYPVS